MNQIKIWNFSLKKYEHEHVFQKKTMDWLHKTIPGRLLNRFVLKWPLFSKIYGSKEDGKSSSKNIPEFIRQYKIDMNSYEKTDYKTFNDFFIRKFKPGARSFINTDAVMPAFAEGRYLGFKTLNEKTQFPVKEMQVTAEKLLQNKNWQKIFEDGPAFIARLSPVDYHRFHFPDSGTKLDYFKRGRTLYSVHPIALEMKGDILISNERDVTIIETKNFGKLAYIEVGALTVGKIVQSHRSQNFLRGEEKGYFLFGGSTVVVLGEKGKWAPSSEILEKTAEGVESLIPLGTAISQK